MKKITIKTIWCILAFSISLAFTNCQSLSSLIKVPTFSLHSVELASINFKEATLLCKVNVQNPNRFDIPFPEIGWELFVNTNSFIKGVIKNNGSIKSNNTTVVEIPLSVVYTELFSSFASLIENKNINYKVTLDAKFSLADIANKVFHLEHDGNIPIPQVPSVSFKSIDVKNVSPTRLDFEVSLEIDNKNSFAMNVNNLSYNFVINNSQWSNGGVQNTRLNADGKTVIPIAFSLNSIAMVTQIAQIITRGTDVSYTFTGDLSLGADLPGLKDLGTSYNIKGTTKLRR